MSPSILMWEHHSWDSPIRVGGRAFAERFLAEGWEVAWLNGPLAPWNLIRGNEEVKRRRRIWFRGGENPDPERGRLFTYVPLAPFPYRPYPFLDGRWFHVHALDLTCPSLFRALDREGFGRVDLLWLATGSPFLPLLERIDARRTLYRLSDETAGFPETPSSYSELEEEAMGRVDLVIATAESLVERARRFNRNVLRLPNGVDLSRFHFDEEMPTPSDPRAEVSLPRVIYVGAIDSWFDAERVATLARAIPQARFDLVGPVRIPLNMMSGLTNVEVTGPVDPGQIPRLLARSRVGIIPFRDTQLTRAIHPVKLYEYCAAGLPVVASDLDEIRRMDSPARLARTDQEWIRAVCEALAAGMSHEAVDFASRNDWSSRFRDLMKFLRGLDEKPADRPLIEVAG